MNLSKPQKRTKPKRAIRKRAKRKAKLHDADRLFSQYVRTRDGWACVRCGSPKRVQCAHLWTRKYHAIRFNPDNATTLCQGCHVMFTHRPIEWLDWCEARWPGRLSILRVQALSAHDRPDFGEICDTFRLKLGVRE